MTDTDKLGLLLEHASEYYTESKLYHFLDGAFIAYGVFETQQGYMAIYFEDIFVTKYRRGGKAFRDVVKACRELAEIQNVDVAFCQVQKNNRYIGVLQAMYKREGFHVIHESDDAVYYKWSK